MKLHPTQDEARNWRPTWSPDGAMLAFQSDRGGDWDIYAINLNSTQERRMTTSDANTNVRPGGHDDGRQNDNFHTFKFMNLP